MKKILITFVLSIICFIGFSNSGLVTEVINLGSLDRYYLSSDKYVYDIQCINCTSNEDLRVYGRYNNLNRSLFYCGNGCIIGTGDWYYFDGLTRHYIGPLNIYANAGARSFKVIYDNGKELPLDGSDLTSVVSSIFTVTGEIIPYVVYIGIGVLLVTLGFFAIKWLVNWLVNKITKYFK